MPLSPSDKDKDKDKRIDNKPAQATLQHRARNSLPTVSPATPSSKTSHHAGGSLRRRNPSTPSNSSSLVDMFPPPSGPSKAHSTALSSPQSSQRAAPSAPGSHRSSKTLVSSRDHDDMPNDVVGEERTVPSGETSPSTAHSRHTIRRKPSRLSASGKLPQTTSTLPEADGDRHHPNRRLVLKSHNPSRGAEMRHASNEGLPVVRELASTSLKCDKVAPTVGPVPSLNLERVIDQRTYPGADAFDGMDDYDEADYNEDQATLKATDLAAAIRDTVEYPVTVARPPEEPMDDEFDFAAIDGPLADRSRSRGGTLGPRLTRRGKPPVTSGHDSAPRQRLVEFDSPASSPNRADSSWCDGADSRKRHSETSATSFTSIQTPEDGSSPVSNRFGGYVEDEDETGHEFADLGRPLGHGAKLTKARQARRDEGVSLSAPRPRERKKLLGREVMVGENDAMDDGVVFPSLLTSLSKLKRRPPGRPEHERGVRPSNSTLVRNEEKETRVKGGTLGRHTVSHLSGTISRTGGTRSYSASTAPTTNKSSSTRPRTSQNGTDLLDPPAPYLRITHAAEKSKPDPLLATPSKSRKEGSTNNLGTPVESGGYLRRRQSASDLITNRPGFNRSPPSPRHEDSSCPQYRQTTSRVQWPTESSSAKRRNQRKPLPDFSQSQRQRECDMADTSSTSSVSTGASAQPNVQEFRYGPGARFKTLRLKDKSLKAPKETLSAGRGGKATAKAAYKSLQLIVEARPTEAYREGSLYWDPIKGDWIHPDPQPDGLDNIPDTYIEPALITPSSRVAGDLGLGGDGTEKVVGKMKFDPQSMCWVSLQGEEAFDWGDDEFDDEAEQGGTIRANRLVEVGWVTGRATSTNFTEASSVSGGWTESSRTTSISNTSIVSYDDRRWDGEGPGGWGPEGQGKGQRQGQGYWTMDLERECDEAIARHKKEMKGWKGLGDHMGREGEVMVRKEWDWLMEVRKVKTAER